MTESPFLLLVRGLPGSGKSTMAKGLASFLDCEHVENDMYHMVDGVYKFTLENAPVANQKCQDFTDAMLSQGKSVIVSNVFPHTTTMTKYLTMAIENKARFVVVHLTSAYGDIHEVPAEHIQGMRESWGDWYGELKVNLDTTVYDILAHINQASIPLPFPNYIAAYLVSGLHKGKYTLVSNPKFVPEDRYIGVINPDEDYLKEPTPLEVRLVKKFGVYLNEYLSAT